MDQRTCIKFCVKNEIKCADAFRMLTGIRRSYLGPKQRLSVVQNVLRRPRRLEKMILANRRITVREVAEDLNISIGSCHSIFINDLGMRRVAAKFVPKLLNCDQKQHRMNIANEMLDSVRDDPNLLQRVITGDKAWVYGYEVETKAQSSQWKLPHEPRPKKARQVRSNVKVLLTVLFDCRGVVLHEFLPQGRTVNKEYYLEVMRNLREAIRQKRPDFWKNKNWLLHHDNAPVHASLLVRDFLAKNNTLMMPQPPYSPDLAPCDFFLFPKLKRPMKGRRYATLDEIKTASKEELKNILKNDFLKCFKDWKSRWHKCIISHGDYFEGDKIVSEFDRGRILAYRDCGLSFREIGSRVGRNQTTVMRICDRWMQEGSMDRRVRSHPPQCTTSRADRQIVRMAVTDRSVTSRTVAQHIQSVTHHPVSARTIRRRLQQNGLSARRPLLLRLPLTQNHRRLCRQWCDERRMLTAEWNGIVFTDESCFCLQHHDGQIRVWRHREEGMLNSCVMHCHTGPAPGIMVWGGIGYHSRTPLVRIAGTSNSQRYISEVLDPVVLL
ncbi:hypothetical protein LAZ67_7001931 [Cordylochernes scorpioides]|uniref:Transposase Tc1-like domain-containing protein n=1 Tax=Cordylochernes scorpioides TaxID=51811 RepID=A0ABY6KMN5_9ARAC|nr:hypothetical protein LAZ67_7001931 [Cordylochernes scorpioides]